MMKEVYNTLIKQVCQALKITGKQYQDMVFDNYFNYCQLHARAIWKAENTLNRQRELWRQDLQKLLADSALFNWYMLNYHHLEAEFLREYNICMSIVTVSTEKAHTLYAVKIEKLGKSYYCTPLLEAARTKEIINTISDENIG